MKILFFLFAFSAAFASVAPIPAEQRSGDGQVLNPVTEICWSCAFPIHLPQSNTETPIVCSCPKEGTPAGFPIGLWEPSAIVEVTRTPYKFVALNLDCSPKSVKDRGGVRASGTSLSSFYHVHYIPVPLFRMLALVPGFNCMKEWKEINPPWCSEWDPSWKHPALAQLFTDPGFDSSLEMINQCSKDCKEIKEGAPSDKYWWCAGCLGSYYPLSGHVAHHVSPLKSSALLVHRMLGKIHTIRWWSNGPNGYDPQDPLGGWCGQQSLRYLPKSFYKMQMLRPFPSSGCQPLGTPVQSWENKGSIPDGGEDFAYLVWTQKRCCFNPAPLLPDGSLRFVVDGFDAITGTLEKIKAKMEKVPFFARAVLEPARAKTFIGKTEVILNKMQQYRERIDHLPELDEMAQETRDMAAEE